MKRKRHRFIQVTFHSRSDHFPRVVDPVLLVFKELYCIELFQKQSGHFVHFCSVFMVKSLPAVHLPG
jgi:hypothetical protein